LIIKKIFLFFVVFNLAVTLSLGEKQKKLPLDSIKLPSGFKIELFATGVKNARSMSRSPKGTLFVGTRRAGNVYAVIDKDNDYKAIFIAEHGSWNRSVPIGYRITNVFLEKNRAVKYEVFAEGWINKQWGRPVDIIIMPDGSLLVSDDRAGVIYRITYNNK
jgi:glucose/arabinose dehydrogenase